MSFTDAFLGDTKERLKTRISEYRFDKEDPSIEHADKAPKHGRITGHLLAGNYNIDSFNGSIDLVMAPDLKLTLYCHKCPRLDIGLPVGYAKLSRRSGPLPVDEEGIVHHVLTQAPKEIKRYSNTPVAGTEDTNVYLSNCRGSLTIKYNTNK